MKSTLSVFLLVFGTLFMIIHEQPSYSMPLNLVIVGNETGQSIETRIDAEQLGQILLHNGFVKMQIKNFSVHSVLEMQQNYSYFEGEGSWQI